MKMISLLFSLNVIFAGCDKGLIHYTPRNLNEPFWYEGTAFVAEIDPFCPERPVRLIFDYVPSDAVLPRKYAWSYNLPDSLKSSGTRMRMSYREATGEEIQSCDNNEHPFQIKIANIQKVK